jgi:hypothetical protein
MAFTTRLMMTCCSWTRSLATGRRSGREIQLQYHLMPLQLGPDERYDIPDDGVDVQGRSMRCPLRHQLAELLDHVRRSLAVGDD